MTLLRVYSLNPGYIMMTVAFFTSCFVIWLMLNRGNATVIHTIDPDYAARAEAFLRKSDGGGIYISTEDGKGNPNLHYGIVIDCGSSGSRLYIYVWPDHSGNPNELLKIRQLLDDGGKPVVKKLEPGLSSMSGSPQNATEYLKSLLDFAAITIPSDKHVDTPLFILATAGLRFLSVDIQEKLLEDLFLDISRDYRFQVSKNHFQVISGKLEGIYSWIAINYVLGKFQMNETKIVSNTDGQIATQIQKRPPTVGILDMGGASAQIAFEVSDSTPVEGEEIAEFSLGYSDDQEYLKYKIYVTTFLGFGANKAFERYIDMVLSNGLNTTSNATLIPVNDVDCLPRGYSANYTRNNRTIMLTGEGDFYNCSRSLMGLLNLNVPCKKPPCSLNGVYQPKINYEAHDFYGFSEFWYTMEDILKIGGPYARLMFLNASTSFCNSEWTNIRKWHAENQYPRADLNRLLLQCFKSAWLYTFLHDGLKFPVNYERLRSASLVNNNDVQWTMGAMLYKTRFLPLKAINQVKSAVHYRQSRGASGTIIGVLLTIILILFLFLYRQVIRIYFYSFTRRVGIRLSPSSSNFNSRYQLLTSVIVDDTPSSTNSYSLGRMSPSISSNYGGKLRSV